MICYTIKISKSLKSSNFVLFVKQVKITPDDPYLVVGNKTPKQVKTLQVYFRVPLLQVAKHV